MNSALLQGKGITKTFNKESTKDSLTVLKDIDIVIPENKMISIVGSSGSGKSTLLHILGGLEIPTEGEVWYKDIKLNNMQPDSLASFRNKNLGFVFQFHHLLPEFTAIENTFMPGMIAGRNHKELTEEASALLNTFGLGNRLHHRPSELSGGEQQRVAVARALINKPDIILADEPTGNLDDKNTESLIELLLQLKEEYGLTMVLVTHDKTIASRCDITYEIESGKIFESRQNT
ncbi:MAG: ABC transporter ATP-binding protein [Balneolales bacterium]|nr:ABC transporter ATP-binding protein [Balneolales bacterium]